MADIDCLSQVQDDARIVMLINDEPAQARLITAIAARDGWRTIVAADAETAIAMLGTREGMQLSAILLDQWVPGKLMPRSPRVWVRPGSCCPLARAHRGHRRAQPPLPCADRRTAGAQPPFGQ
jgi:hypothetical protein